MDKTTWTIDWIAYWLVKGLSRLLNSLPIAWALGVGRAVGRVLGVFHKRKSVAYANLKAAFGSSASAKDLGRIVRGMFEQGGMFLVELLRFPRMDSAYIDRHVSIPAFWKIPSLLAQGHPVILLTGHVGNWEMSQIASSLWGQPVTIIARDQKLTRLNDLLNTYRSSHGSKILPQGAGLRGFIRELKRPGLVGILGDPSGGREGLRIPLFGRETTAARGAIELALRTRARVLVNFITRAQGPNHHIALEELPLPESGDFERDVEEATKAYFRKLEDVVRAHPEQWLWGHKRWKHCWTKHVVVLQDGRAGHEAQTEALVAAFQEINATLEEPLDLRVRRIRVRYRTRFARALLYLVAPLFYPWAQGRLAFLRAFLVPDCAREVESAYADLVVSAGSSLLPILHLMAKESMAKRIAVLKAPFPYSLFSYDLAVIPEHDRPTAVRRAFFAILAVSCVRPELARSAGEDLRRSRVLGVGPFIGVLIGGSTGSWKLERAHVDHLMDTLLVTAESLGAKLLVSTSRRTDESSAALLRALARDNPRFALFVDAERDNFPGAVLALLGLSDVVCATADSVSMISEAVGARKPVLVFEPFTGRGPAKHERFLGALAARGLIVRSHPDRAWEDVCRAAAAGEQAFEAAEREREALKTRLREVLA